jgi:hypothetical protein
MCTRLVDHWVDAWWITSRKHGSFLQLHVTGKHKKNFLPTKRINLQEFFGMNKPNVNHRL